MPVEKINIEPFLLLAKKFPVIDVRSPGEYNHAHIPGATNLPLFSDEERKIVGTAYKQQSRQHAIKIGLDFFGPKMRAMVETAELITGNNNFEIKDSKVLLVHCWRGGMRSAAIAWLLDLYGFKIYTLNGGYKKYRHYVLDTFNLPFRFNILGGFTGSGKTKLLSELKLKGQKVIDLEELAGHKGSAFGNIGLPKQPSHEMFENMLAMDLRNSIDHSPIWLEDESQRIGLVNIPSAIWKNMRQSAIYFLDIPFEERLKHIVQEYGQLDTEKLAEGIERIRQKLGNLNAKTAILLLNEGKITECFSILLTYYDKYYLKGLHNREALNSLLHTIECKSVTSENAKLLATHITRPAEKS